MTGQPIDDNNESLEEIPSPLGENYYSLNPPESRDLVDDRDPTGDIGGVFEESEAQDLMPGQRYKLALVLLGVTVAFSIGAVTLAAVVDDQKWSRLDALVPLLLTPFQTLLGAAIGWYFGGGRDKK